MFLLGADVYDPSQLRSGKKNTSLNIYISDSLGHLKNVGLQLSTLQRGCKECYYYTTMLVLQFHDFPCGNLDVSSVPNVTRVL